VSGAISSPPAHQLVPAIRIGSFSVRLSHRYLAACAALTLVILVIGVGSLLFGEIQVGFPRLVATLQGDGTPFEDFLIFDSRLPRVVSGVVVGAGLAMSGAIFQTVSRNPLGSPDVIGFEAGAASGGLIMLLVYGSGFAGASVGAVVGGSVVAALVYLLAFRGGLDSMRLVLIGIGIGSMLLSLNSLLIVRADVYDAQSASSWLVGNLAGASWGSLGWLSVVVGIGAVSGLALSSALALGELSDESATGLGQRVSLVRLAAVGIGVLLSSVAVAAAGPIAFVALSAPQIGRRLTRASGPNLLPAALTGSVVLVGADLAARELFQPRQLPVGVVTGVVGGLFLAWLLGHEWRKGRA
jgi:iron-siderophore transport system permease protein